MRNLVTYELAGQAAFPATGFCVHGMNLSGMDIGGGKRPAGYPGTGRARSAPLDGLRIIVVEDDFFIGLELAASLEALGAEVSGPHARLSAARAAIADEAVDGAVLDVNLGRETSLEFARELIDDGVPVLFATAYADSGAMFDGPLSGLPRLAKPVAPNVLQREAVKAFNRD